MKHRFTLCITWTVVSLMGAWTVHSLAQELFDEPADEKAQASDDLFADGDASDAPATDDLFDSGSANEVEAREDGQDLLLNLVDEPNEGELGLDDLSEDAIGLELRERHDDHGGSEDLLPGLNGLEGVPVADDSVESAIELTPMPDLSLSFSRRGESRQTVQKLAQYQQSILQRFMRTKNKTTRDQLTKQLTGVVSQEFAVRQQGRAEKLKALEQELKRLRSIHEQREREKDTIVRNRVRQLIRDKQGLGWGSESVSRSF